MAKYISDRDGGYASNPSQIYLTSGASEAIRVRDNIPNTDEFSKRHSSR